MKRAVLIHCWTGYPEYCWYPYVKQELTKLGFNVEVPFFPDVFPLLSSWLKKIEDAVFEPDENMVLIGHSLGSIAVLKYLQSLNAGQKVGTVILVSGFLNDLGFRPLRSFFEEPFDFEKIKSKANEFILFASDNDPYITPSHTKIMKQKLGARVIWTTREHFTDDHDGHQYKEFPELIAVIRKSEKVYNQKVEKSLRLGLWKGATV